MPNVSVPRGRIALGLLLLCLSACDEVILHNLSEEDANRARVTLAEHEIDATKVHAGSGWNLSVSSREVTQALQIINKKRVVPKKRERKAVGGSSFVLSKEERLLMREQQISSSLEETLLRLPGVLEARVHLFLEAKTTFAMRRVPKSESGSVLLVVLEHTEIDAAMVQELVSGASGIPGSKVRVMISREPAAAVDSPNSFEELAKPAEHAAAAHPFTTPNAILWLLPAGVLAFLLSVRALKRGKKPQTEPRPRPEVQPLRPPPMKDVVNGASWQEGAY